MNQKGFTLSEVLVTLTVIGVVSIMTIPSFVKNYNNHIYSSKISKTYAQINEAVKTIMADEETDKFTETKAIAEICDDKGQNCKRDLSYFLTNYFKVMKKKCGVNTCISSQYSRPDGNSSTMYASSMLPDDAYCVQTVEGVAICALDEGYNDSLVLEVDTTGKDGPNIAGYDYFILKINENIDADNNVLVSVDDLDAENFCNRSNHPSGCLSRLMSNGWKIDY